MKIISIEKYKGNCLSVECSDGDTRYLHSDIVSRCHLTVGTELSEADWESIFHESQLRRAKERALYLLEDRDHSFYELYEKLEKTYSAEIALEITQRMVSIGLVNDRAYGERLTRRLIEGKHYGAYRVRQELLRRGLDEDLIDELLEPYEEDTGERLKELIRRKYLRELLDEKGLRRAKSALVRNGYSYQDVGAAVREVLEELEEREDESPGRDCSSEF